MIIIRTSTSKMKPSKSSPVVHDVSSFLRWFSWSHPAVKREWTNPFYPAHVCTHVHATVKISPAQLKHISSGNVNSCSWHVWNILNVFLTNIGVFALQLLRSLMFFFLTKCMVGTSKRLIFLALPCMYLTSHPDWHVFYCSSSHLRTEVNVFLANVVQPLIRSSFEDEWVGSATSGKFKIYQLSVTEMFIMYLIIPVIKTCGICCTVLSGTNHT